jgi:hypothetical protein
MSPTSYHCSTPRYFRTSTRIDNLCEVRSTPQYLRYMNKFCPQPDVGKRPRPLVQLSSTHYCAYTCCLSNKLSTCGLTPFPKERMGDLILGWASHLDAFSAYPIQTWLPSTALGRTTGTLEVCPSQSSRTRESSPQISCAHNG